MRQFSWGYFWGALSIALAAGVGYGARSCGDRYFDAPMGHVSEDRR